MGAARHPIMVIQNWMDPLRQDREVREWAEEMAALYTSYSTLGGQWTWHQPGVQGNPVLSHPTIERIAAKHQVSPVLAVLSWALQEKVSVIPRSSKKKHIAELAAGLLPDGEGAIRTFLDEEDMDAVREMEAEWEAAAGDGDEEKEEEGAPRGEL